MVFLGIKRGLEQNEISLDNIVTFRYVPDLSEVELVPFQFHKNWNDALRRFVTNKSAVRCAALGAQVPGHCQKQLTQTLIVRLLKTHIFTPILDCEKSTE